MATAIKFDGGKYTLVLHPDGRQEAFRYGEPWRELTGDHLIHHMAQRILELEQLFNKERSRDDPARL